MISMRYYNNNKDKRNWVLGLPHKDLFIGSQSLISYTRWYRCSLDLTKGISFPYSYQLSSIGVPRTFVLLLLSPRYTDNRDSARSSRPFLSDIEYPIPCSEATNGSQVKGIAISLPSKNYCTLLPYLKYLEIYRETSREGTD